MRLYTRVFLLTLVVWLAASPARASDSLFDEDINEAIGQFVDAESEPFHSESQVTAGNLSTSFSSSIQIRFIEQRSSLLGRATLSLSSGHELFMFGQKKDNSEGGFRDKAGLGFRWNITDGHSISIRAVNSESSSGEQELSYKTSYGARFRFGAFNTNAFLGYEAEVQGAKTIDVKQGISKKYLMRRRLPVLLSASGQWRQRESANGTVKRGARGLFNANLRIFSNLSFNLEHYTKDDLNNAVSSFSGSYTKKLAKTPVSIDFGANDRGTLYIAISLGHSWEGKQPIR